MKIVICDQCGRALHETDQCFHCGGTSMRPGEITPDVPAEAAESYGKMELLLSQRKFAEVISLSRDARKWLGNCAEFYWMRLLAKMECATDLELILRGADLDNEEDYGNAGKYAAPEEYQVYAAVQEKIEWLRMELNGAVRRLYRQRREALHLADALKEQEAKADDIRSGLQITWTQLAVREMRIRQLELDATLALEEQRQGLKQAIVLAGDASKEASRLAECSESQYQTLLMRLTAALQLSEQSADMIRQMEENHPWLEAYKDEQEALEELKEKMEEYFRELETLNRETRSLRDQLTGLESEQEAMLRSLRSGSFREARKLLGTDWAKVLENAQIVL